MVSDNGTYPTYASVNHYVLPTASFGALKAITIHKLYTGYQ